MCTWDVRGPRASCLPRGVIFHEYMCVGWAINYNEKYRFNARASLICCHVERRRTTTVYCRRIGIARRLINVARLISTRIRDLAFAKKPPDTRYHLENESQRGAHRFRTSLSSFLVDSSNASRTIRDCCPARSRLRTIFRRENS